MLLAVLGQSESKQGGGAGKGFDAIIIALKPRVAPGIGCFAQLAVENGFFMASLLKQTTHNHR